MTEAGRVRTCQEVKAQVDELKERIGNTRNKTAMVVINAQIEALEWVLGGGASRAYPPCEWCITNDCDHRRVGSKPMAVWVAPNRDSDGQATSLTVSYTSGEHVGEGEAEYVRRALRAFVSADSSTTGPTP